ncbi:MAG: GTPase domain-containing protein, partial [Halothece sp. Uz-M2-17]|nr:GTPase domain-containing protein [Halothece sp. Uz-M2-17]
MSLNILSSRIDQIIEERGKQVQVVEQYLENLNSIDEAIKELRDATNHLSQHPQVSQKLKSHLQEFYNTSSSFPKEIISAREQLEKAKNRFNRPAITIGCSGQARVGKSTLLQTMGNLPEEAIPTGKGIPVTAVRSRLRHSHEHKAILSLRDKRTFIEEYIQPFHKALNLEEVDSFEDFKNFDYNHPELTTDENVDLMGRLKNMQAALRSYENQLTGETKIIEDLTQLRPWVAYPDQESENDPSCSRLYLAVKNVEIQCSFLLDVEKLMLVDLPGLGEVNVDAEQHHVQGLKNEVDLVLLILRPTDQSAYWGDKDRKALNLTRQAVEGLSKPGDFVLIVINHPEKDEKDQELYQILINDVHKQLNETQPNSRYQVLTCNAKDPESVREQVLEPALEHLIDRLPLMDKEVIDSSLTQWQETLGKINTAIQQLETSLQMFPSGNSVQANNLIKQKAKDLRDELAEKLELEVLEELEEEVYQESQE